MFNKNSDKLKFGLEFFYAFLTLNSSISRVTVFIVNKENRFKKKKNKEPMTNMKVREEFMILWITRGEMLSREAV